MNDVILLLQFLPQNLIDHRVNYFFEVTDSNYKITIPKKEFSKKYF